MEKIEDKSMEKWEKDEAEKTKHCSSLYIFTTDGDRDKELMAKCRRLFHVISASDIWSSLL
jgi:SRSO17 transposase